jgi:hypothetical protein
MECDWTKKAREHRANTVLGNVGPEIKVSVSSGGKNISLFAASYSFNLHCNSSTTV